ncbi:MAG: polysaccharide biosynthesis/export family protein [Saprospiraceae bacterium]
MNIRLLMRVYKLQKPSKDATSQPSTSWWRWLGNFSLGKTGAAFGDLLFGIAKKVCKRVPYRQVGKTLGEINLLDKLSNQLKLNASNSISTSPPAWLYASDSQSYIELSNLINPLQKPSKGATSQPSTSWWRWLGNFSLGKTGAAFGDLLFGIAPKSKQKTLGEINSSLKQYFTSPPAWLYASDSQSYIEPSNLINPFQKPSKGATSQPSTSWWRWQDKTLFEEQASISEQLEPVAQSAKATPKVKTKQKPIVNKWKTTLIQSFQQLLAPISNPSTQFPISAFRLPLYLFALALTTASCVSHAELVSFNAEGFPQSNTEDILNAMELKIQPEDLLRITVHSANPIAAQPYNLENIQQSNQATAFQTQASQGNTLELFMGYFVDQTGAIDFPGLGRIQVGGMTLDQAKFEIYKLLQPFLNDAVVNIRFLNFKVTVTGEVNAPGAIKLTNKRVTLLEAIAQAGDLSPYASRTNVLIMREQEGKRTYTRINLQSPDIFSSPYFYLQQNDFIYVEPLRARTATVADPAQRIISYSTAALSLISIIIALTR